MSGGQVSAAFGGAGHRAIHCGRDWIQQRFVEQNFDASHVSPGSLTWLLSCRSPTVRRLLDEFHVLTLLSLGTLNIFFFELLVLAVSSRGVLRQSTKAFGRNFHAFYVKVTLDPEDDVLALSSLGNLDIPGVVYAKVDSDPVLAVFSLEKSGRFQRTPRI